MRKYFCELENDGHEFLFPSQQSDHMTSETLRNITRALASEAEVAPRRTGGKPADPEESHPHAPRCSLANYILANEKTRLIDVRDRLRHRSITTTERIYEHFQRQ
ncbi:tyrosine-type recombinase/integrase [Natronorubrum sp. FCH18a]|uniref:tyrosine-type recombinase/integrase n=1 Tax=Natronorubrum sp. FCH18a TaxID=3447018 RepID=UPI003F510B47